MDDEVPDDQPARFVIAALQLLRNDLQDAVKSGLSGGGVGPPNELVDVLANDERKTCDAILFASMSAHI